MFLSYWGNTVSDREVLRQLIVTQNELLRAQRQTIAKLDAVIATNGTRKKQTGAPAVSNFVKVWNFLFYSILFTLLFWKITTVAHVQLSSERFQFLSIVKSFLSVRGRYHYSFTANIIVFTSKEQWPRSVAHSVGCRYSLSMQLVFSQYFCATMGKI